MPISGLFIYYVRKIFRKTNISYPLIRTHTCAHQGVRNGSEQYEKGPCMGKGPYGLENLKEMNIIKDMYKNITENYDI